MANQQEIHAVVLEALENDAAPGDIITWVAQAFEDYDDTISAPGTEIEDAASELRDVAERIDADED